MAEITRHDLIEENAITAFKDLSATIDLSTASLTKLIDAGKKAGVSIKATESTNGLKKATEELTAAQIELQKIEKQIETAQAKNTEAYRARQKALQDVKTVSKEVSELGQKDSLLITAQNSSLKQLEAALKKNTAAYRELATEEARASKEGKQLKEIITQQDIQVKALNGSLGNFKGNVGNYEGAISKLKEELKAARGEMVSIGETLGQSSKEYQAAAKRAGEIGDKIADAKDEAKAFQGDTSIENLGTRFGLLGDKVKALDFKGAAVQIKGIAELAKAMTFKEAIAGLGGFGSALASLGKALLTNPIFLIGATITAAVLAFNYFSTQAEKLTMSTLDRMDRESKAVQNRYDLEIALLNIAHKDSTDKEIEKNKEFIKAQEERFNKLNEISFWQRLTNSEADRKQREKDKQDVKDSIQKASDEIIKLNAEKNQKIIDAEIEARKKIKERVAQIMKEATSDEEKEEAERLANLITVQEQKVDHTKEYLDEIFKAAKEASDKEIDLNNKKNDAIIEGDEYLAVSKKRRLKEEIEGIQEVYDWYTKGSDVLLNLSSNLTAQRIQDIDSEINKMRQRANEEIILAGGNAEEKAKIQAKYDLEVQKLEQKKKSELRKQAEVERANDIIKASILGIQATLKGLLEGGPIVAAIYATLAGIQIAAIASKPLPQYFKGTDNSKEGFAWVGERGSELKIDPSGEISLTPGTPTLDYLKAGTKIIPHEESMKALALNSLNGIDNISIDNLLYAKISSMEKTIKEVNKELVKAVKESSVDVIAQGSLLLKVKKGIDGSRKLTRSKAMG